MNGHPVQSGQAVTLSEIPLLYLGNVAAVVLAKHPMELKQTFSQNLIDNLPDQPVFKHQKRYW